MAEMTLKETLDHPDFKGLPVEERRKVLTTRFPDFTLLPPLEQNKVLGFKEQQQQPMSFGEEVGTVARMVGGRAMRGLNEPGLVKGAAKGALSTASKTPPGQFAQRLMTPTGKAALEAATAARTPAEKAGRFGEQAAEFMIPETLGLKVTKAPGLANLALRTATEAGKAAGVTGFQTGFDPKQMIISGALGGVVLPIAGLAGKSLLKSMPGLLGRTTGTGPVAVKEAVENATPELIAAMRGGRDEIRMATDVRDAVADVVSKRRTDYQTALKTIAQQSGNKRFPNLVPGLKQDVIDRLRDSFRVKVFRRPIKLANGKTVPGPYTLDFSSSAITDVADQRKIRQMFGDLDRWKDDTAMGLDALKQRIDSYFPEKPDSRAGPLIQDAKNQVRSTLNKAIPGYEKMTQEYAHASKFLDEINREFNTHGGTGTLIRKIFPNALNQNNEYRRIMIEALDREAGSHLKEELAGGALREWMPRGLVARQLLSGEALVALFSHAHAVEALGAALASSPRAVGEVMALISNLRRNALANTAARFGIQMGRGAALETSQGGQQ